MNESPLISFKIVFSSWRYLALALIFALGFFYLIASTYSHGIIRLTFIYSDSILDKINSLITFPWLLFIENTNTLGRSLALTIMVLSGINIAMFIYYFRRRLTVAKYSGAGIFGTIIGLLGIGCASCGSILLSSLIGLGATSAVLYILPFQGTEISVLGIIIILTSIYFLANKIKNPVLCRVTKNPKIPLQK